MGKRVSRGQHKPFADRDWPQAILRRHSPEMTGPADRIGDGLSGPMQGRMKRWPMLAGLVAGLFTWVYDYGLVLRDVGTARSSSGSALRVRFPVCRTSRAARKCSRDQELPGLKLTKEFEQMLLRGTTVPA